MFSASWTEEAEREKEPRSWAELREALSTVADDDEDAKRLQRRKAREQVERDCKPGEATRLFSSYSSYTGKDVSIAHLAAHRRRLHEKLLRLKSRRIVAKQPCWDTSDGSQSTASVPESDEDSDVEVDGQPLPDLRSLWTRRHACDTKSILPPLREAVQFTSNEADIVSKRTAATQDKLAAVRHALVRTSWSASKHGKEFGPEGRELSMAVLGELVGLGRIATLEERRATGRVFTDAREHLYADVETVVSPALCALCFAGVIHALPNNEQPESIGPTVQDLVDDDPSLGNAYALFSVRVGSADLNTGGSEFRGQAGTYLPQPVTELGRTTLRAIANDRPEWPLPCSGAVHTLSSMSVTVTVIQCIEAIVDPHDFILGRHGLLIAFRDVHGREFSGCLLPDFVERLGNKERAIRTLVRESGYVGSIHSSFWSRSTSALMRIEASAVTMNYRQYRAYVGLGEDRVDQPMTTANEEEGVVASDPLVDSKDMVCAVEAPQAGAAAAPIDAAVPAAVEGAVKRCSTWPCSLKPCSMVKALRMIQIKGIDAWMSRGSSALRESNSRVVGDFAGVE